MSASGRYVIGVDIGGTFTDCVVLSEAGEIVVAKTLTTQERADGFFAAIAEVAKRMQMTTEELLGLCERLVHGTTTGTNAIVQRQGARVGLITTAGHRDVMFLMKGGGRTAGLSYEEALDLPATDKPMPIVPKELIVEVAERVDVDGDVVVSLDEDGVRAAIAALREQGVEALAVSLLWSTRNPVHEQRIRAIVEAEAPDMFVSCGSDLVGAKGEYERTTTAVLNAFIGPLMQSYVKAIEDGARERGFSGRVLFAQCAGGAITGEEAQAAPIRTVQSGPVSGILSTAALAGQIDQKDVLLADMGGTTLDVSVIRHGTPLQRISSNFIRYEAALPMLDVESIGAGGGSIAFVDASGRLNVGPASAGADPGPACYGRGGTEPTVTDADVVLGLIDPSGFLGGEIHLDVEAARSAIGRIADVFGLTVEETAAGINRIVDSKMADLVGRMSVLKGFDPREFVCYAFGGGGPVHAVAVAREVGIERILIPMPAVAPVWSALGAGVADVSHVYQEGRLIDLPTTGAELERSLSELERRGLDTLAREGFEPDDAIVECSVRMKYRMQVHDVVVPLASAELGDEDVRELEQTFHGLYEQKYGEGSGYAAGGSQITGFEVRVTAPAGGHVFPTVDRVAAPAPSTRMVYWAELQKRVETPVLKLDNGQCPEGTFVGPFLLEPPDTVVVVPPGHQAAFDDFGNLVVEPAP